MLRTVLSVCLALLFSAAVFAQEAAPAARANDDSAQLQSLEQETQLQMRALEEQRGTAGAQDAEVIEERVADLKFQYEIRRLTILLEQAEEQGDNARAAEVRRERQTDLRFPRAASGHGHGPQ
ncbi:MAG: hypothetical protein NT025_04390 [bacterium]|nr:hypothetical protein [bacterium]